MNLPLSEDLTILIHLITGIPVFLLGFYTYRAIRKLVRH